MSRSYRKTPIRGVTGARSDAWFKKESHQAHRSACRRAIYRGDEDMPDIKLYQDPYKSEKDGKFLFDPKKYPEYLRK